MREKREGGRKKERVENGKMGKEKEGLKSNGLEWKEWKENDKKRTNNGLEWK